MSDGLFSITLLTLVPWARHAKAVMVNMRRWGIVDLCLLPQRHSWRITLSLLLQRLLLHLTTQTSLTHSQADCKNRCFPEVNSWQLALRSNRGVHVSCTQVHMCSCEHCYAVVFFFEFLECIWDIWSHFCSPQLTSFSTFPPTFPVRGVISPWCLCDTHVSSTPLTGELPAEHKRWDLFNTQVSAPLFLFPPSPFPTLPSRFPRSSVLGFPHLQHIRVFILQLYSPQSS